MVFKPYPPSASARIPWLEAALIWWAILGTLTTTAAADTAAAPVRIGNGFGYRHELVAEAPWSIQIARYSRSRPEFSVETTLAADGSMGVATVSEQMAHWPRALGRPLAAVNGDYFIRHGAYQGDPEGLQICRGELVSAPNGKSCFWVDADGNFHLTNVVSQFSVTLADGTKLPLGLNEELTSEQAVLYTSAVGTSTHTDRTREYILERHPNSPWLPVRAGQGVVARVREIRERGNTPLTTNILVLATPYSLERRLTGLKIGSELTLSFRTSPDLHGARTAIGGGPALIREGQRTDFRAEPVRHPRTALAWNRDDFFLVQVDGRQPGLSVGMTLHELADYLLKLGCTDALNLDGGGSSTLWAGGQVMSNPSEGSERPTGNALAIMFTSEPKLAKPADARNGTEPAK